MKSYCSQVCKHCVLNFEWWKWPLLLQYIASPGNRATAGQIGFVTLCSTSNDKLLVYQLNFSDKYLNLLENKSVLAVQFPVFPSFFPPQHLTSHISLTFQHVFNTIIDKIKEHTQKVHIYMNQLKHNLMCIWDISLKPIKQQHEPFLRLSFWFTLNIQKVYILSILFQPQ